MLHSFRSLILGAVAAVSSGIAHGQSDPLVSKSIPLIFSIQDRIFAFSDIGYDGQNFSKIDFFTNPSTPAIKNDKWKWAGGALGGIPRNLSLILRSDAASTDTARVHIARAASLFYDGSFSGTDSLILPLSDSARSVARGAAFTALSVSRDTAILGFGRLGLAYARLGSETGDTLFADSIVSFAALPSGKDSAFPLTSCVWNRLCHVDSLYAPSGGLDSILSLAVDSSAPDSMWLLIGTHSGLRRGLWGSRYFPRVSLPGIPDSIVNPIPNIFTSPNRNLLWVFTGSRFFFSGDHGRTFHVPVSQSGKFPADSITGYASTPEVSFLGDTTFVNFHLDRPGLALFRKDTLLYNAGTGLGEVLLDAEDSLAIVQGEGSLTSSAVARIGSQTLLAIGSTFKGVFYKRMDLPGKTFSNLNKLRAVSGGLEEIITYPTLFGSEFDRDGTPKPVHIGYRLKKNGKVTITVFNYAMEKVRVLVKNAPRNGGGARSENPLEDRWDGKDDAGRSVSVGTYYILVESDQGEKGFGKALCVRGRR